MRPAFSSRPDQQNDSVRARNNSLSIDGLDNRDETTGSGLVAVGQEAVAEFRVSASSVAPEFGGGAGGILNVVTISGTNRFHGVVTTTADTYKKRARSGVAQAPRPYPGFAGRQDAVRIDGVLQRFVKTSHGVVVE